MSDATDCISKAVKSKTENVIEEFVDKVRSEISSLKTRSDLTEGDKKFIELAEKHVGSMKSYVDSVEQCKVKKPEDDSEDEEL